MLEHDALAIVTPLQKGANRLPRDGDLARLLASTTEVVLTAMPSLGKSERDRETEKVLARWHSGKVQKLHGWGHVRARRAISEPHTAWEVDLDGDARWMRAPAS
jgi:hypothetical protein